MTPWTLIVSFATALPWLLISLGALIALLKKKKSPPILLQLFGAVATLIALPAHALVVMLLSATHAPFQTMNAAHFLMDFLSLILILLFAVGYAWEKFARK